MKRAPTGRCARCPSPPITADNSIGSLSNEFSWFQTSVFVIPGPPVRHSRESGNPGGVGPGAMGPPYNHPWIPAFAGMTYWGTGNDVLGDR